MDSQCPGYLGQAVVTLRLPCAIVESPRRHKRVPFVNIAFLCSRSIKRRQWNHKLDYYGVVFAHLSTGCGIKAKDPSGLDSDWWIPHSRCCEKPALPRFTDLNPALRGLSLYNIHVIHTLPWITIFGSLVTRFANDFHSWLRHSWKLLANRLTRDPKIVIHGNSCIILYIFIKNIHFEKKRASCLRVKLYLWGKS